MAQLSLQKRLAASVTKAGIKRVKIPPENIEEVISAVDRKTIRQLIEDGKIIIVQKRGVSRARAKVARKKRRLKSEGRGPGSRKGKMNARRNMRKQWIMRIRKIRRYLKYLRDSGVIDKHVYRRYYLRAKGGSFKSLADMRNSLIQEGYIKRDQ